jgi:hypothetical protein
MQIMQASLSLLPRRIEEVLSMRMLWQAIRAALIETLGIATVLWLLFILPTWGLQPSAETSPRGGAAWAWLKSVGETLHNGIQAGDTQVPKRQAYTEQTLDVHSRAYRQAAADYARRLAREFGVEPHG